MNRIDEYTTKYLKKHLPKFDIGDTVDVIIKIQEGEKERKQTFQGTVIARNGHGIAERFTVRRIVQGEGVERVFPMHSPSLVTVKVKRKGKVRRAKLYYLRDRIGKATKVKEKIWSSSEAKRIAKLADDAAQEAEGSKNKEVEEASGTGEK